MKKLLVGVLVLVVIVVAAGGVLLYFVNREAEKASVAPESFAAIRSGMTTAQVQGLLGKAPEDGLTFPDGEPAKPTDADCDYYLRKDDAEIAFRVCFVDGRVVQKAAYKLTG